VLTLSGYYLRTHKLGEKISDCQDAIRMDDSAGLAAIADGATESFAARQWAQYLVESYVRLRRTDGFSQSAWLSGAQQQWVNGIQEEIAQGQGSIFTINSFNGLKAAYATFLGLEYMPAPNQPDVLTIFAEALGDSCLLHFSKGRLERCFPLKTSAEFSDRPEAISSRQPAEGVRLAKAKFAVAEGDSVVLATDAFAKFLLTSWETASPLLAEFLALREEKEIREFVGNRRSTKDLENDDIALAALVCRPGTAVIRDFSFSTSWSSSSGSGPAKTVPEVRAAWPPAARRPAEPPKESESAARKAPRAAKPASFGWGGALMLVLLWLATALALGYEYGQLHDVRVRLHALQEQLDKTAPITADELGKMQRRLNKIEESRETMDKQGTGSNKTPPLSSAHQPVTAAAAKPGSAGPTGGASPNNKSKPQTKKASNTQGGTQ
jgi:hypothetical protein